MIVQPVLSDRNRSRLSLLRRCLDRQGYEALAASVRKMSGPGARAALVLALATEDWLPEEKAALDPFPPKTTYESRDPLNAYPPPALTVQMWGTSARQIVAATRSVRHTSGPSGVAAWVAGLTAGQARDALALAIATEGWSAEAKAAIDPNADIIIKTKGRKA